MTELIVYALRSFEERMAALFEQGKIKAPLHLSEGNEQQLIDCFAHHQIGERDWVLGSWRSHLHCLLKGVPGHDVEKAVLKGHSISLCFPKYRVLCSGIVGGIAPIATGIGLGIKRRGGTERVFCFVGDMTSTTGIFNESLRYVMGQNLPVTFIIEDNGKSVCTPTKDAWGQEFDGKPRITGYNYELKRPHVGTGIWVKF